MHRLHYPIFVILVLAASYLHADTTITGKVVGITDGDTITVLQDRTQYKIRLYGIDTPEKRQDFGSRAKQFTSDLVFGKAVTVIQKTSIGTNGLWALFMSGKPASMNK